MRAGIAEAILEFVLAAICIGSFFWLKRTKMAVLEKVPLSKRKEEQLSYLSPLEQPVQRKRNYWEQKIRIPFLLSGGGFFVAGLFTVSSLIMEESTLSALIRNETGGGTQTYALYIEGENEPETYYLEVKIGERKPTKEQADEQFLKIYERLFELIPGENRSLERVDKPLFLPEKLEEMGCTIQWMSDTWEVLSISGEVKNEGLSEPCMVYLTAEISYGDFQEKFYFPVQVYPKENAEGTWIDKVEKHIAAENEKKRENIEVELPQSVEEQKVTYRTFERKGGFSLGLLAMAAAVCIWLGTDYKLPEKKKKREEELIREYSSTVSKLTLLIGAGMSIRLAWERIVEDNMKQKRFGAAEQEMQLTYYELRQGETEGCAYRNFGRRIGLKPYRKLGNLLEQNLRKGNAGLAELLRAEVAESFEIRRSRALMAGEEASSKLLIPMFLMLITVLIICMAPALMTF